MGAEAEAESESQSGSRSGSRTRIAPARGTDKPINASRSTSNNSASMDLMVSLAQAVPYRAKVLGPQSAVTMAAAHAMTKPASRMSKWEPLTGNSMNARFSVA